MAKDIVNLPVIGRAAEVRPETIDAAARTIDVVWTTGAIVRRLDWSGWDPVEYDEELVVDPGAVRLDRLNAGAPFLNAHSAHAVEDVIGSVVPGSVRIDAGVGTATIQLTTAADAQGVVQRILDKSLRFVSVGYRVHQYEITRIDGQRDLWRAVDWEPMEISAVPVPADAGAQIRSDPGAAQLSPCVLVRQDDPAAVAALNPGKETTMSTPSQQTPDTTAQQRGAAPGAPVQTIAPPVDADAIRAEERQRAATISQLVHRHALDAAFGEDLISRGVSVDQARAAILDKIADADPMQGRISEPARARDGSADEAYRGAMSNALLHRSAAPGVQLSADGREFRGMTLMELARHALERSGVSTRGMSKMELASAALGQRSAGYHTSGDFPTVLANIGNITLRAAYGETPRTFQTWARRATLTDFRPTTRVQVSNAPALELVKEGAEFKYGTFGEASTQYALATYGKILSFSRQMLIDDALGAFTRVANSFGARAAQLEGDIVYSILLNNAALSDGKALFHADHGNLGAAAQIDEAGLTAAFTAFAQQTGTDKEAIDVSPTFLIVPPGQRALEARKQMTATTPASSSDVSAYSGLLTIVEERRLLPASGTAPWFLAASTALIDTVEYSYLDGEDGLFTETRNGFEVDGVEIKARLDFAAAALDHRGLYKNPGKAAA